MCELLGLNFNQPVRCSLSFRGFRQRGEHNPHGWGIARFDGRACQVFKEPIKAPQSKLATFLRDYESFMSKTFMEWHPKKNGNLRPSDVYAKSSKKAWWLCSQGHSWEAVINSRSSGRDCPYCNGQKVGADNCLQTINPELAKEWHPTLNGELTPNKVTVGSGKKAWWICSHKHEWCAVIGSRVKGAGCPYCSGRKKIDISNQKAKEPRPH